MVTVQEPYSKLRTLRTAFEGYYNSNPCRAVHTTYVQLLLLASAAAGCWLLAAAAAGCCCQQDKLVCGSWLHASKLIEQGRIYSAIINQVKSQTIFSPSLKLDELVFGTDYRQSFVGASVQLCTLSLGTQTIKHN
jgi:hypothetical protein